MTTGAEHDLRQVTGIARQMVVSWGMSPKMGLASYGGDDEGAAPLGLQQRPYSDATAQLIDAEVRRIVEECFERACVLLDENRPRLEKLTQALLREDSLGQKDVLRVTGLPPNEEEGPDAVLPDPAPANGVNHHRGASRRGTGRPRVVPPTQPGGGYPSD